MLTLYMSGQGDRPFFKRICLALTIETSDKIQADLIRVIRKNPRQFFMASVDKVTVVNHDPAKMDIAVNKTIRMTKPRRVKTWNKKEKGKLWRPKR